MMEWNILLDSLGTGFSVWYISFLWHSLLVFTGMSLVLFAYRKNSARVKCLVWAVAVLMMLVMPSLSKMAPNNKIPVYNIELISANTQEQSTPIVAAPGTAADMVKPKRASEPLTPFALFFALYAISVITMIVLFFKGRRKIRLIVLRSTPILDSPFLDLLESCSKKLNISRKVQVLESDDTPVPFTTDLLHPVIVLPSGLYSHISHEENRHILLHELAHIKRFDSPLLVMAAVGRALLFLNPFIWFAVSRISSLTEDACDELVVEHYGEPVRYARTLTAIAETIKDQSFSLEYVAGFVFSRHVFLRRIESILSMRKNAIVKLSRKMATGLVILMGVLFVSIVSFPVTIGAVSWRGVKSPIKELEIAKNKASTQEQREAIENIQAAFKKHNMHYDAIKCVDMILDADRNVEIIGRIGELAIATPYHTEAFIKIAKFASKSKVADDEFIELAEMARKYGSLTGDIINLARKVSKVRNEKKLAEIRDKIKSLDKKLAAIPNIRMDTISRKSLPNMTMKELEIKLAQAETWEKREAIENIRDLLKKYNRHMDATKCVDMILEADRNVEIIGKIAEYAIKTGYHTGGFISIAEYAAVAPVADDEFMYLAKKMKRPWASGKLVEMAKKASEAQNESELKVAMRQRKWYSRIFSP